MASKRVLCVVVAFAAVVCAASTTWGDDRTFELNFTNGGGLQVPSITVPMGYVVTLHIGMYWVPPYCNFAVYQDATRTQPIFVGAPMRKGTNDYTFTAPSRPGTYHFCCDLHATTEKGALIVAPTVAMDLSASATGFAPSSVAVPAGGFVTIRFHNSDGSAAHNLSVYSVASGRAIFLGRETAPSTSQDYFFLVPRTPGEYTLRCDGHPEVVGSLVAVPCAALDVTARNGTLSTDSITVAAGSFLTVRFTNADEGAVANLSFYDSPLAGTAFFQGAAITGPATADYMFYAPFTPGTYYFCNDANSSAMSGSFIVTAP